MPNTLIAALVASFLAVARVDAPEEVRTPDEVRRLMTKGDLPAAQELARALLEEAERRDGPESLAAAQVLDVLVEALGRAGRVREPETRALAERALTIKERALGLEHKDLGVSLNNLALVNYVLGDYEAAQKLHRRNLAIRERVLGPTHPEVGTSLNNLASLLAVTGQYQEALALFERALGIWEGAFGPQDRRVAMALDNMANIKDEIGDYAGSIALHERSVGLHEQADGPESAETAVALGNLGNAVKRVADYGRARQLYERAIAIQEKTLGPKHRDLGTTLHNLASLLLDTGDHGEARAVEERSLAVTEAAVGPEHASVASALTNLGVILGETGAPERARELHERALRIREKALGPGHPDVGHSLYRLGELAGRQGDPGRAQNLLTRALGVQETALGPHHPFLAETLTALGRAYRDLNQSNRARPLLTRALAIREEALGTEHPLVAETLVDLARVQLPLEDPGEALTLALRAETIGREHFRLTAQTLAERQALRYAALRPSGLELALSWTSGSGGRTRETWDALIRSRALVLDEMAARRVAARTALDTDLGPLFEEVGAARRRLAHLAVRGGGDNPDRYRKLLDEARRDRDRAERIFAERTAGRWDRAYRTAGFDEVAAALPPGSGLVAFARHPRTELRSKPGGSGTPWYVAFILRAGSDPDVVPLGPAAPIDRQVARWRREIRRGLGSATRGGLDAYRTAASALRRATWDPVARRLGTVSRVFIVPDGSLSLVQWAALPARSSERYLVQDGPVIHLLSAERDLVPRGDHHGAHAGLLALGAPNFDAAPPSRVADAGRAIPQRVFRGLRSSCGDLRSAQFGALPATDREVTEVRQLWSQSKDSAPARVLTGDQATEAAFKTQAPGHRFLHVATHGFFLSPQCTADTGTRGVGGVVSEGPPSPGENPLLLSGLALAGANRRGSASPEEEDGILTAEEIATLDLGGVEWAVLSACDTGLGEAVAGEGVLGLRRAFQVAGARTLVMSLWAVEDENARDWMLALYEARFARRLPTAEAVREASLRTLEGRRKRGLDSHPAHWAGFVAAGDWR